MPQRIQRKRTKSWRMPQGAVYVGRPTIWGNPFGAGHSRMNAEDRRDAVDLFRKWWLKLLAENIGRPLVELRGKDLACWCPLDQPCHADVLLELANAESTR